MPTLRNSGNKLDLSWDDRRDELIGVNMDGRGIGKYFHIKLLESGDVEIYVPSKEKITIDKEIFNFEEDEDQSMVEEVREILYTRAEANDVNPEEFFEDIRLQDDSVLVETESIGYFGRQTSEALKEKNYEVSGLDESVFDDNKAVFLSKVNDE